MTFWEELHTTRELRSEDKAGHQKHIHQPPLTRTNPATAPPSSYNYGSTPTVTLPRPIAPPSSSVAQTYTGQGSITRDPMAVYDPWPEYQRKQETIRTQKAVEDAARAVPPSILSRRQTRGRSAHSGTRGRRTAWASHLGPGMLFTGDASAGL